MSSLSVSGQTVLPVTVSDRLSAISCPRLSEKAEKAAKNGITVYGTLSSPVHATNLESILSEIYFRHSKPFCIAVDASLGTQGHIGYVTVGTGPLKPGLGVNKQLLMLGIFILPG